MYIEMENMFKIKIYVNRRGKSPIKEWMSKLNKEAETNKDSRVNLKKLYYYLDILSKDGTSIGEPYVKHLEEDVWELRPIKNRVLFFCWEHDTFVLLHYFQKKTQKTPRAEIEQAKRNRDDFLEDSGEEE